MNSDGTQSGDEGQVSEVGQMDPAEAETPISDSQGVFGNPEAPDDESDSKVSEGDAGSDEDQ